MPHHANDRSPVSPLLDETPSLTLYLVRHGRTEYNVSGLMQGWCDSPLTEDGLAGVRATAAALAGHDFVAAYASSSGRAATTAKEILAYHPETPLTLDDDLREFHFGDFEAAPEASVYTVTDPKNFFAGVMDGTFPGMPGAEEDSTTYLARVDAAFQGIVAAHPAGGSILVVSHGVTLLTYLRWSPQTARTSLDNACVSVVSVNPSTGERELLAINLGPDRASLVDEVRT